MPILPDVLAPGLRIVFCGTAASRRSAQVGAYYGHRGNRFWETLHQAGFTPMQLAPRKFLRVLEFGIGLTDLNQAQSGVDSELNPAAFDVDGLAAKVIRYRPRVLAFTSKNAARWFQPGPKVEYGRQPWNIGESVVWVLPSTSGSARPHWPRLKHHWYELGERFRSGRFEPAG